MLIPHNRPCLDEKEVKAVKDVINSGWVAQGEKVQQFEKEMCKYIGLNNDSAIALSNGTSAIYLALKTLGIKTSLDEVIIPSYVCSAVINAVFLSGAKPVIVDIDKIDFNITFDEIKKKINKNTKYLIIPHTFGVPANVIRIKELGIPIIEDCAQAIGSKINDTHVGLFGDIGIFSFYASKVITTGNGGMLFSRNSENIEKARDYREFDGRKTYYPRFNFQMTDIQAAMGIVQLNKLNHFLKNREEIAQNYIDICQEKNWDYQRTKSENFTPNWFRFVLKADNKFIVKLKDDLLKSGIKCIIPIEDWELLSNYLKLNPKDFENSEFIAKSSLSLPIFPDLIKEKNFENFKDLLRQY